jgi:hypothetical protein
MIRSSKSFWRHSREPHTMQQDLKIFGNSNSRLVFRKTEGREEEGDLYTLPAPLPEPSTSSSVSCAMR